MSTQAKPASSYTKRSVTDASVTKAAEFAAQSIGLGSLVKLASARGQTTEEGPKYKLALHIKYDKIGSTEVHAHVVEVLEKSSGLEVVVQIHTGLVE